MLPLYNILFRLIYLFVAVTAPFIPALRDFLTARNGAVGRWRAAMAQISQADRVWFHVASVGELEQVRPVIERMAERGIRNVVLSYFSPSVARAVKDFSFVAYADFLPLDFSKDMRALMAIVKPRVLVLNRYDLWPNHLAAAREAGVPVVLVNASTPPFGFLGTIGLWLRFSLFQSVSFWTYVDSEAADAWEPYIRTNVKGLVAGNPRVDRAVRRVDEARRQPKIQASLSRWQHDKKHTIVAGSTWWEDESVLLNAWGILRKRNARLRLVLVPHEPTMEHLEKLTKELKRMRYSSVLFSKLGDGSSAEILVVDGRGFLAEIYGDGSVAYVGGGFTREIHSIIEPLAHELPVAFGPKCQRSPEAEALLALGSAFRLRNSRDVSAEILANWFLTMLDDGSESRRARDSLRVFLSIHRGAGERVGDFLAECLESSVMLKSTEVQHGK
jgi:3-deoxy-D-manno-octulosonic-acid transferase